ncbi:Fe-S oxidoreductase [Leucobacter sp. USHLN153]|uniref:Fe-S oxidoreductase n=1 Tax=Leucobacter sp. USHLN153 TaxID=3081268 RepID=UPI003015D04F
MQLGARWRVGDPPHRSVPVLLHGAIAEQELAHPKSDSWTLTWLEGRPRCELDDVAYVGVDALGHVLSGSVGAKPGAPGSGGPADQPGDAGADDADDDDWLS